ncbi:TreTu family toxin [Streptococcus rupicaprae]|uniref:TreTu family toxin n=1 Tax=Streptococcus rupicaprae TaxID=759619 RepID=UPI003F49BBC4
MGKVGSIGRTVNAVENTVETTRVGRWMSLEEYKKMVETGKVQMSDQFKTHVSNPADINSFKAAPSGSVYVEFDVPSHSLSQGGRNS